MNSERRIVEKEIHRFALNDKLMVNCQWLFSKYMIWRVPRITINH